MTQDKKPDESPVSEKRDKIKKGLFPRLPLSKVLELPRKIYEVGEGETVRRVLVFDKLGKSPESGPSRGLVTVSSMYGLTRGGYQAEYLELTDLGKLLVTSQQGSKKFYELIYDVLFSNDLFSGFVNYWKNKSMPSDDVASDWLVRNYQLSTEDGRTAWEIIKSNILDWNLTEQLSGKRVISSRETALEPLKNEMSIESDGTPSDLEELVTSISPAYHQVQSKKEASRIIPKPFGAQILERDFTYGRARLILPEKMTKTEITKLNNLIQGLITEVDE